MFDVSGGKAFRKDRMDDIVDLTGSSINKKSGGILLDKAVAEYSCPNCNSSFVQFTDSTKPYDGPFVICKDCDSVFNVVRDMDKLIRRKHTLVPPGFNDDDMPHIVFSHDARGSSHNDPYKRKLEHLQDPDPQADAFIESTGATIIDSSTFYPKSRETISKRSETLADRLQKSGNLEDRYYEK